MRPSDKFFSLTDGIGSLALMLLFTLLVLISCAVMVNALFDLKATNKRVTSTISQAAANLEKPGEPEQGAGTGDRTIEQQVYLDKLESRSRGMLDSNTISFLFQIFALALVSAGVYMLSRYHRSLIATEENARRIIQSKEVIQEVVEDGTACSSISGLLLTAFGISCSLQGETKGSTAGMSCVASVRQSILEAHGAIETAIENKRAMGASQRDIFVDQIAAIKNSVKKAGGASDVEKMCDECILRLREGGFVERQAERRGKLKSVWQ